MTDLRIVELRAQNFARLKAVQIRPTPNGAVKITGANKGGKTSCLLAIEAALRGRAGAPAEPIRRGADEALLHLDLGEIIIDRTIQAGDPARWSLTVTRKDGSRISKTPQAVIDSFYSALTIDPLAFVRADTKAQAEMLKRLVPNFDFAANARQRQTAYDERTHCNRRAKEQRILAQKTPVPAGPKPQPIDVTEVTKQFDEGTRHNTRVALAQARREEERRRVERMLEQAENLRAQAAQLERDAAELEKAVADSEAEALRPIDLDLLRLKMIEAEETKAVILAHETRAAQERLAENFERDANTYTATIENLDGEKNDAISRAQLPAGLSFDENGVFFNDLPFAQASSAEAMEVACAVAMALSPDLKVILVDGAERLDSKEMAALEGIAAKAGYSLWLTIVDESGKVGFCIEDGELK